MNAAILTRRGPATATTFDPDSWTIDVVLSSGSAVTRLDARGEFDEVLDIGGAQWSARLPLLDSHARGSIDDQLGYITDVRREGGKLVATAHLSRNNPKSQRIAADLADGHGFALSIGYAVDRWADASVGDRRRRLATHWRLVEASIVPLPADPSAGTRSIDMEDQVTTTGAADNAGLYRIAEAAGMTRAWADERISAGADAAAVAETAIAEMQRRNATAAQVRSTGDHNARTLDNPEVFQRAAGEALYARVTPGHQLSDAARPFAYLSCRDVALEVLKRNGISAVGLSGSGIITRALHSTSDFPLIMGDTIGRTLRAGYQAAQSGLKTVARSTTINDFRVKKALRTSQFSTLEKVGEHGEFKRGTFEESGESIRLDTFGRVFGVTRQALVNDDLGAFSDISRKMGVAVAQFEATKLVELLLTASSAGPTMGDGSPLFHISHGNLAASGAAIGENPISDARKAMRAQTDASGQLISVSPKYLVVGPAIETAAEKFLASITPATTSNVNPFAGKLTLVVEPRLTGNGWYVVADPAEVDGLEYAHLEGEPGPQIETRSGFDVDGVETRVRLDFGAAFMDWRGWYRNAGA